MGSTAAGAVPHAPVPRVVVTRTATRSRHARAQPLAVGLLAALLALGWSWHVSLWTDEAATISATTRPVPQLWQMLGHVDAVHGLWYLAMHPWVAATGTGPVALRFPSTVGAGLTAAGVVVLARRLLADRSRRAPLVAGLVAAVLPRLTWAGIEARPYVWTATAAVWLTVLLHSVLHRGRPGRGRVGRRDVAGWVGYALVTGVAVSLNVYLALVVVGHGVTVLLDRGVGTRRRLAWLAAAAVGAVLSGPVLLVAAGQTGQLGRAAPGPAALARQVLVNQYLLGETPTPGVDGPITPARLGLSDAWAPASVALAVLAWALVALSVATRLRDRRRSAVASPAARPDGAVTPPAATARSAVPGSAAASGRDAAPLLAWAIPWVVVPTAAIAAPALVGSPLYSPRYLTCTAPAFALLVADGLIRLAGRRRAATAVAAVLVVLAAPIYVSQRYLTAKSGNDWSEVAGVLARHRPGDAVYFAPRRPATDPPYLQTTRPAEIAYPGAYRGTVDPTLLESAAAADTVFPPSRPLADSLAGLAGAGAVWVVARVDHPAAAAAADAALLTRAGFRRDPGAPVFTGPLTVVVHWTRDAR